MPVPTIGLALSTCLNFIHYRGLSWNEQPGGSRRAVDKLMKGWMNSPHHKKNILGSYCQIGVVCAIGESEKRYWCVTFGLLNRR
jgi:uncharacterized protein YkwD